MVVSFRRGALSVVDQLLSREQSVDCSVSVSEKTRENKAPSYSTVLNREVEVIKMCHTDLRNSNTLTLDIIKRSPHLSVSPKT